MEKQTVVVALSGGVDSAVAALLIKKKYKVIGAFMKNFSDTKNPFTNECNWREEYKAAQKVALQLQIPLHLFDFE
ncbi:MAG TPA: 7-cyano-7-deazaguanine synthase, partial [Candidatus Nanoarchaeia archaeon]|nr:7-cyano-7-deazaguanine synthase [Candidatus Nanoarchaeia archaeon]